jgi:hypothetical protein
VTIISLQISGLRAILVFYSSDLALLNDRDIWEAKSSLGLEMIIVEEKPSDLKGERKLCFV